MSTESAVPTSTAALDAGGAGYNPWRWLLVMGIAMLAIGAFVIGWSCLATVTLAATWAFGFVLLVGGIIEIITAFTAGRLKGIIVHLLMGVLYVVAGYIMIDRPAESALLITKFLAIFLIVGGIFRILSALVYRIPKWGLVFLSGILSLVLGVVLYKAWPEAGLWFLGLAFGIDLMMSGWTLIALALGMRRGLAEA